MNMKVKKLLSLLSAAAMAVTSLTGALTITASAADDIFDYSQWDSQKILYLQSDYMTKGYDEIVVPDDYNGEPVEKVNLKYATSYLNHPADNVTQSLTYGKNISSTSSCGTTTADRYELARFKALKTVKYLYDGTNFDLQSNLAFQTTVEYSDSIEEIYIYANGISNIGGAQVFRGMNMDKLKIHVTSDAIADQIYDKCKSSQYYTLKRDQFIVDLQGKNLPTPKVEVTCEDITYGTEGGFKPSATVKINDELIEDADVSFKLYTDASCAKDKEYDSSFNSNNIGVGTYYLKATVAGTDDYAAASSDPLEVHVNRITDIKKLQEAIEKAGTYTTQTDVYSAGSLNNLTKAVDAGKALTEDTPDAWAATQETVDAATEAIEKAITGLVNIADACTAETWNKMIKAHDKANNTFDTNYTPESYEVFKQARDAFNEIYNKGRDGVTEAEVVKALEDINAAFEKLERKTVFDFSALEEAVEKAKPIIEDPESADTYTSSTFSALKAAYEAAVAILEDRESVKDQVTIYNAEHQLNDTINQLVKVDKEALYNELKQAISDAEARDADIYTADTYKAFKDALDAAKKITMSSTAEQIETATANLKAAIEGLKVDQDIIPAGGPLGYIYHTWTETPFYSGTTDDAMVGAIQVRLTFDCADDTSFNSYFNTNYTVNVGTTKTDTEVRGTALDENLGEKGCTAILNLNSPIEAGKSYNIIGYTYGYNTSKDYVFAITKIEFLDANGKILKTITDITAAKEQLDAAIAKAGDVDAAAYTAESYAELTKAVDAAKALTDKATVAEITAAKDAIEAAIKALVPIEVPVLGAIEGTIKTPGADAEVTVTVATADGETVAEATAANGEYSISDLEDGEYIVTFAADGYAARSYTAAVAGGSVTLEAEIHLYGDVNGDGEITTADVGMANSHAREVSALEGYDFDVAEVTGDGEVTTADVGVINATAQKI